RETYRDGQPIDSSGTLHTGESISGPEGLRDYLADQEDLFRQTLCTKLAGYALGRGESVADAMLIARMTEALAGGKERVADLVEIIVRSRQFRYGRGVE